MICDDSATDFAIRRRRIAVDSQQVERSTIEFAQDRRAACQQGYTAAAGGPYAAMSVNSGNGLSSTLRFCSARSAAGIARLFHARRLPWIPAGAE
jgi:hypothetical protein